MSKKQAPAVAYVQPYRYASPNIPLAAIRRFARQIAERFHPDKIILFGSYAYGTPHNESDVDLLVIMPTREVVNQAIRICVECKRQFSLDLIVRTPFQMARGLKDDDWFLREIVEKGKVVYESPNGGVGKESKRRLGRGTRPSRTKTTTARSGVLPLPAICGEVPKGTAARNGRGRAKNA
jgi:predicted nucleotidyltransferase